MKIVFTYLLSTSFMPMALSAQLMPNTAMTNQSEAHFSGIMGIRSIYYSPNSYNGYFDNSGDLIVYGFEAGKSYVITLYNIIGNKFFTKDFLATGNSERFDIGLPLNAGIYLVSIILKNEPSANAVVIKVIKND